MKKVFFIMWISCATQLAAQDIASITFNELNERVTKKNDTLYVLNFWATWCRPCIEELPIFEKADSLYSTSSVKFLLVNLDFNKQVKTAAEPFVRRKKMKSEIVHLTDTDPNEWINKIDSVWSGAIPATVMFRNSDKLYFKEGQMTEEELKETIKNIED